LHSYEVNIIQLLPSYVVNITQSSHSFEVNIERCQHEGGCYSLREKYISRVDVHFNLAESASNLHSMLNLFRNCIKWKLKVNIDKAKVMILFTREDCQQTYFSGVRVSRSLVLCVCFADRWSFVLFHLAIVLVPLFTSSLLALLNDPDLLNLISRCKIYFTISNSLSHT
jgi:hypothetical protein